MPNTAKTQNTLPGRPTGSASVPGNPARNGWLAAGIGVMVLALVTALLFTGAAAAAQLSDPGALTRWGLPVAKAIQNGAVATVIGALVFAVVILPKHAGPRRGRGEREARPEHPAFTQTMALASGAAAVWTISAIGVLLFTYSDVSGLPLSPDPSYTEGLASFLTDFSTGRAWLAVSIIAAVVTTLTFGVRSLTGLALTAVLAVGGLLPMALVGHAAGGDDHSAAVNSIGLHLLGVCLWIGGIIVLAVIAKQLGDMTGAVLRRFSALALFGFVLVSVSGIVNASLRITSLEQLDSRWGGLVIFKVAATVVLGIIGFLHRRWIIPRLPVQTTGAGANKGVPADTAGSLSARRVLWQFVGVELLIMAAISGVAAALARTAPPRPEELPPNATPARILTGYDLPPELTPERYLTEWRPDWLWIAIAVTLAVAYVLGVIKLYRRGDKWPIARVLSWFVGLIALTYVTSGAPTVYGMVLFSTHMLGHMSLSMVIPLFLVLGGPVALALKALTPRTDGSRGLREWILIGVHSRWSKIITHPIFAAVNFAGSIVIFYYSEAFGFALRQHVGHELMVLHFLLAGYIFVLTMIGIDPLPTRAPYPLRLLILLATMAFHAFFGVAVMGQTSLIQASYFGNMGRDWGLSALADQQLGGAIMWGVGEIPTVLVAIGVAIAWSRSDARETKRKDRAAERNNDADLTAYNNMFAQLAERDARTDQGEHR